ncbi:acetolactate synthase small subunit [Thermomicrobium roseum]|jgi:acetolactate synthase-1/3 small subunit|uniref:Acetolactate synthase small subunit n=1 Tax=Thermomicrobium roseum (strain ATCC 27502 / DSM 5159 / P-2) TaxID=309801 RepID=B9KYS2_THERP|nr:acetolactate synthase small subunit [Thermomicrobium roseum]ACM05466.1 acetolactate synthase, small subunit [Thermomicrobium roseum DSM 5159]MBO9385007.1 acetolactate synthase small subunit [Thermomicrobium sp.]MBO9403551.1 acetolactate synthase small subunit [Thermomicrobium sp.]
MVSVRSHTLVVLVEDKPGVMNRIVSLFRQRGFNIDSIAVGHSETPGLSRITLVAQGDDRKIEQLVKQLYKILEVIKITDVTDENLIQRELALIKVTATDRNRSDIMRLVTDVYQARIVDATPDSLIVEVTGPPDKIDSLITMVRSYGIKEIARSGVIAMARGARVVATTPQPVVA